MDPDKPTAESEKDSPIPARIIILVIIGLGFIVYNFFFGENEKHSSGTNPPEDPIWMRPAKELKSPIPDRLKTPPPVEPFQKQLDQLERIKKAREQLKAQETE